MISEGIEIKLIFITLKNMKSLRISFYFPNLLCNLYHWSESDLEQCLYLVLRYLNAKQAIQHILMNTCFLYSFIFWIELAFCTYRCTIFIKSWWFHLIFYNNWNNLVFSSYSLSFWSKGLVVYNKFWCNVAFIAWKNICGQIKEVKALHQFQY